MAQKRTLNERRLTKRQVRELISSGARPRPDLSSVFQSGSLPAHVYELEGDRFLFVFNEQVSGLGRKGDIYAGDDFRRFVRWTVKVDEDVTQGRQGSVGHWAYYSPLKHRLATNIDTLVAQLRATMSRTADELDFSYASLDIVSEYVETIGVERAQEELYDQLVAYVGKVLRLRIQGTWEVSRDQSQPYPYLAATKYDPVMPINVVWGELSSYASVNLRVAAANEVRRKRKSPGLIADAETSIRAAPKGVLAALPADAYKVTKRWADGRPCIVIFEKDVEVAGVPCRGEAAFNRKGDLVSAKLSREWHFGMRRFVADSRFRYYRSREDGRLNDVRLGADQKVNDLPCLGGTLVWFHPNQRVSSLHLASDREVDGIPCASGEDLLLALNFHPNGRLASARLGREHVLFGRAFPPRTWVNLDEKGRLVSVVLPEDCDIDGIPVRAGTPELKFHGNGRVCEATLARSQVVSGRRYDRGTLLRFDRDGQLIYVQP